MYVKVAPRHTPQYTFYPTVGPVQFGRHWSENPPEQRSVADELDINIDEIHLNGIVDRASNEEVENVASQWKYSYAWWTDENGVVKAVVTSGSLYIVGDNGKTIDRA